MDWLFGWFGGLFESLVWKTFISHFIWIDWVTFLLFVIGVIYGAKRGLMREVAEILEVILVTCLVLEYFPTVGNSLLSLFSKAPRFIPDLTAYLLTTLVFGVIMILIDQRTQKWAKVQMIKPLRLLGGALLGGFHFLLLWSFISQPLSLLPLAVIQSVYERGSSYSGRPILGLAPSVHGWVADSIRGLAGGR